MTWGAGGEEPVELEEARADGKARRSVVPRSEHAFWDPPPERPHPLELVVADPAGAEAQAARLERMRSSAGALFREAPEIMAADLALTPSTGIVVQQVGDAHVQNTAVIASSDRRLVLDVVDLDETAPGPWEWDLKRLATSVVLTGRAAGLDDDDARAAASGALRAYRKRIDDLARTDRVEVWFSQVDADEAVAVLHRAARKRAERSQRDRADLLRPPPPAITDDGDGPAFVRSTGAGPDEGRLEAWRHRIPAYLASLADEGRALLGGYELVDVLAAPEGVPIGRAADLLLLAGGPLDRPLVLRARPVGPPAAERFGEVTPAHPPGERVGRGGRLLRALTDVFAGWVDDDAGSAHLHLLWDVRAVAEPTFLGPAALAELGALSGLVLARAHARTGDAARIAGYLGKGDAFDDAVTVFAAAYADQVEQDHARLVAAAPAPPGP